MSAAPDPAREGRAGALLLNLGSPDSPAVPDVRRYLREFLSDPRVIDSPAVVRWLLLNLIILPTRPARSAQAYAKVWTPQGSPLIVHSQALRDGVEKVLGGNWVVALGMRYQNPSIRSGLETLAQAEVSRLVVLPLFPQYSEAANGSALAKVRDELHAMAWAPPLVEVPPFYAHPGFVDAVAAELREALAAFDADYVLFSYHGLPERQIRASDPTGAHCLARDDCCAAPPEASRRCYRAHCYATTRAVVAALALEPGRYGTSFQSRLGRTPWIRPFTDRVLPELAASGTRRLAVVCPSFVADCLETLEEIGIRARDTWRTLGGDELRLVPAPNARPAWARAVADLVRAAR